MRRNGLINLAVLLGLAAFLSGCSSSPFGGNGYSDANRYRPECGDASNCTSAAGHASKGSSLLTPEGGDWFKDGESPVGN